MDTITIGRIVEFHPNNNEGGLQLPNGMKSAPAMVTQVFGGCVNLNVFTANPDGPPVMQAWSVSQKVDAAGENQQYWDWLPRV